MVVSMDGVKAETRSEQRDSVSLSSDDMALIGEALRIAGASITESVQRLEVISPGGYGAERLRVLAERMADLHAALI